MTSSESVFESHGESLSDCSDSQYDADIEETVDQSTSDELLTAVHNAFRMSARKTCENRTSSNRSTSSRDSKTSLNDLDKDANFDSQMSPAASNNSKEQSGKWQFRQSKQDSLSDDDFDSKSMKCFPQVEKTVYDPDMIAIQLKHEEDKLKRQNRQELDKDSGQNRQDLDQDTQLNRQNVDKDSNQSIWDMDRDTRQRRYDLDEEGDVSELASDNNTPRGDWTVDSEETVIADLSVDDYDSFIEKQEKHSEDASPSETPIAATGSPVDTSNRATNDAGHYTRSSSSINKIEVISDQVNKRAASKKRLSLKKNDISMEEISKRNVFNFLNKMTTHTCEVQALVHRDPSLEDVFNLEQTEIQSGRESDDPDMRSRLSTIISSRSENTQISAAEDRPVGSVEDVRQDLLLSPSTQLVEDDTNRSPLGNRLSTSENPSPLYSSAYEANDQLSLSCSRSATDVAMQSARSRSAKRGLKKSRGSWCDDSDVPKLYKVLSATEVARRSAELVAVELSRRKSGTQAGSETNMLNSPLKRRKSASSSFKQSYTHSKPSSRTSYGKSPDQLPGLRKTSVTPRKAEGRRCLFVSTPSKTEDGGTSPQNTMRYGRKSWQSRSISRTPPSEKDVSFSQSKQRINQTFAKSLPSLTSTSELFSTEFSDDVTSPDQTVKQMGGKSGSSSETPLFKRTVYLPKIEMNQQQSTRKMGKKTIRSSSRLSQSSGSMPSADAHSKSYQTPKRIDRKSVSSTTPTENEFESTVSLSGVKTSPQKTPRRSAKKYLNTANTSEWENITPCPTDDLNQLKETGKKSKRSIQFSKAEISVPHTSAQTARKSCKTMQRTPQSWTPRSPSWTHKKSVQIWASSLAHHSENTSHSNCQISLRDETENQMEKPTSGMSPEHFVSDISQSETPVSDVEASPPNEPVRRITRSMCTTEPCQSESVQKCTGKPGRKSIPSTADAEQSTEIVHPATVVQSYSPQSQSLKVTSSHIGKNDRKSQARSSSSDSELTNGQKQSFDGKLYSQSGLPSIQLCPKDYDKQSESSGSPKSFHSDDKRPFLEVILSSEYTAQKTLSSTSQSTEDSGRISQSQLSKENVSVDLDDGVKQAEFSNYSSAYEAVQYLDVEMERMKHATEIFHTLLNDEIQFVVELEMQNALNEKMSRIYDGRNQDDNTIVSCNRSKYSNIYKNIVDKTFDKTNNSSLHRNTSGCCFDGKDSKKNKTSGKQVVTPIRIRKTQQQDQSAKSIKWTVEKLSKEQNGKKSTKKHKKNISMKDKSNEKAGCSSELKKGNSHTESKTGDKMESSSSTFHGKLRSAKSGSSDHPCLGSDNVDGKPDDSNSSGSNSKSSNKLSTNKPTEKDAKYSGSNSKRTQAMQKQHGSDSCESQVKDAKLVKHGQKISQSNSNYSKKEPRIAECTRPKKGYNDDSALRPAQSDINTSNVLKNTYKTSRKADDAHQSECGKSKMDKQGYSNTASRHPQNNRAYKHNSNLQANRLENESSTDTKHSQKAGTSEPGYEFSRYFISESESRTRTGSGSGDATPAGSNRRTVLSEEMLNEMVSSNPFAQSVESLKSLNNCCVIKQLPCDTRRVTRQMTCHAGQGTRQSPHDTGYGTKSSKGSVDLPLEKKQDHLERKNGQASSGSEQLKKQMTNESGQTKRYPGEIDIVAQLLSTAIPDKKKKSTSPSFSRSGTMVSAPHNVANPMTMSAESLAPPNVSVPMANRMRCGIGLAPAGYSPVVDNLVMNHHHMSSSTCYAVTVQSASSVYFSSPQGSHFMNTGSHGGFCSPRMQGPLGRDMHSTPIPFPPPVAFGDTGQCFLEHPVYGGWFVSNSYPPPGRLSPGPDDGTGFTSYRPFHGYQNARPFRKTFDDAGPYLFPVKQKQKPVLSIVSEYSIPMMQTAQRNKEPRMQHRDSYSGNATKYSGEQSHAQAVRQKAFSDCSRSSHNLGSDQSKNNYNSVSLMRMRSSRSDSEDPYDRRIRARSSGSSSGLKTNSEAPRTFAHACKACGKGSHYFSKRDPRISETSKNNKSSAGQCRTCSEVTASQSKSESDTCAKSDANNNSISEDHLHSENLRRMDNISSKNGTVSDADAAESEGSEAENMKKPGKQETCQTDNDQSQTTDTSGCTCKATVQCKHVEDKPLKQYLKMKFSLTSTNCPVHSDRMALPCTKEITGQGEAPSLSKQQKEMANSQEEKGKTPMRRKFRTVKDRILESVKHLQEANFVDQSNSAQKDDVQCTGSSIQLCPRNPSEGGSVCLDSCDDVSQEPASTMVAVKSDKSKQRKRSKRLAKSRKNFIDFRQKMLQGEHRVGESRSKEQDILLKLVTDKQPCKGQGHIDEHDLRIGDANGGRQLGKREGQVEEDNQDSGGSAEGKNTVFQFTSDECNSSNKMEARSGREDSKTNDQVTVGVSGDSTTGCATVDEAELSGRRQDAISDTRSRRESTMNSDMQESERKIVGNMNQIR